MKINQICLPKFPVEHIANRILCLRRITRIDQQLFMSSVLSKESLSPEEQNLVEQVYKGLSSGFIRVVD
ncbi:MAG: hypothetical protein F6K14_33075 [Symploca sp. SIO2C1]|nr:hypothetical protein [Symploca sp. SIO2C1]